MPQPNNILTVIAIGYSKILQAVTIQLSQAVKRSLSLSAYTYIQKSKTLATWQNAQNLMCFFVQNYNSVFGCKYAKILYL